MKTTPNNRPLTRTGVRMFPFRTLVSKITGLDRKTKEI
nr:MAG TPA: T-box transcription factor [Caudoviricetes sp.]